jgi:leader peptidase (prepilin peptidase)/N-methyltransferase
MNITAAVLCGLFGIPVGAFLNLLVERTPDKVPLGATLEGDVAPIQWLGLPVQPWLLRRGPRHERQPRWLAVELVTVAVYAVLGATFGDTEAVLPLLVLGGALVAVSAVDIEHYRIPDRITFPALGMAAVLLAVVSLTLDVTGALGSAVVGAAAYFGILLLAHLVSPRGMGFGDVKLALLMGLFLGWWGYVTGPPVAEPLRLVLNALILGCLLGVVFGLAHRAVTKARDGFPFGPALAVACLVVLILAAP